MKVKEEEKRGVKIFSDKDADEEFNMPIS